MPIQNDATKKNEDHFTSITTPSTNPTLANAILGPKFVIPIIFIPGIMGSNIMSNDGDQVWFPPNGKMSGAWAAVDGKFFRTAKKRQRQLNPETTQVSNAGEINLKKKDIANFDEDKARSRGWGTVWWDGYGAALIHLERFLNRELTKFDLSFLGIQNEDDFRGSDVWRVLTNITGSDMIKENAIRSVWNPTKDFKLITKNEFGKLADYAFPVFALGYNWLQSNDVSAKNVAERLNSEVKAQVKKEYPKATFKKFIIVTHSMGGLVTRSLIQDDSIKNDILGVVHGVMPASGAPTVYKRFANGWDGSEVTGSAVDSIAKHVFGATCEKLTPVLGNSPGGLQLLPFANFVNTGKSKTWLKLIARKLNGDIITATLPKSDPYDEIYKDTNSWWRMVNMDYLDPASILTNRIKENESSRKSWQGGALGLGGLGGLGKSLGTDVGQFGDKNAQWKNLGGSGKDTQWQMNDGRNDQQDGGLEQAEFTETSDFFIKNVSLVQNFHESIKDSYHTNTYAHYGNDPQHLAFNEVVWETEQRIDVETEDELINYNGIPFDRNAKVIIDPFTGEKILPTVEVYTWDRNLFAEDGERKIKRRQGEDVIFKLHIAPNPKTGAGDGTVCHQSGADVQRDITKQVFVINGYDHASSYKDQQVLANTLYSIAKIVSLEAK
ncbi:MULTISPECIES: esterase/lipase family protein [Acinetobacter]|uniref:esterase/lipase family protein n=2 Tax=Moraxellaceae TaxID=468 RepID=UPI0006964C2F|nr:MULTISPECIES: hypothetical protein [Acinetobacter]